MEAAVSPVSVQGSRVVPASPTSTRIHTVKPGETLSTIARKYAVRLDTLEAANPKVDARKLQVGQVLSVPGSS